jgi:hypothetical protein
MKALATAFRAVGLLAVVGALVDPGCAQARRPTLDVTFAGHVPEPLRERERRAIAAAAPWATVRDASLPDDDVGLLGATAARIVVGDPAPVLAALHERAAAMAWQVAAPTLVLTGVHVPARVVSGTRTDVIVHVADVPAGTANVRVVVSDALTGGEQARADVTRAVDTRGGVEIAVPWLATGVGQRRLRIHAMLPGNDSVRPSPPGDVVVDVRPATVRLQVLEGRPTWAARFARLALSAVAGIELQTEVRVAPGIRARTSATVPRSPASTASREADVILVGGVDALTGSDVARLEAGVRERGQALVLLMDELPGDGPWRRLWPDFVASLRRVPTPIAGRVGGHVWKLREWLAVSMSTGGTALASLESGSNPILIGRALGAGRIVLVTALDAWRWRADADAAFAAGWQSLVQRLGADVPPPVATTAWASGHGRARTLQVEVTARPDVIAMGEASVTATAGTPPVPLAVRQVDVGRWRAVMRARPALTVPLVVEARTRTHVAGQGRLAIDVTPLAPVASWDDVARHQQAYGRVAAGRTVRAAAMDRLHQTVRSSTGARWFVTRTWWFAGIVLGVLGAEWIVRRLSGAR